MTERVWGLYRVGRFGGGNVWYGHWRSRADALAYLTRECGDVGSGGTLAANSAEWFDVRPIEWSEGDVSLRTVHPLTDECDGHRNKGGDDG